MVIAEFGSVFYSVKFKDFDDRGMRRQADREFSRKAELESQIAKQREEYVTADFSQRIFIDRLIAGPHGKRQRNPSRSRFRAGAAQRSSCPERRDIRVSQAVGLVRHLGEGLVYDGRLLAGCVSQMIFIYGQLNIFTMTTSLRMPCQQYNGDVRRE